MASDASSDFSQITEYLRLQDEYNALVSASREYNPNVDPSTINDPEIRALAQRIAEYRSEASRDWTQR
jgi:hypothetical protein